MPHAAQIAGTFLAHIGDEQQIGTCAHACRIHRAQPCEQHGKRSRIIADTGCVEPRPVAADREVGARWEHRVEMRRDADQRTASGARTQAGDVALRVDLKVPQAVRLGHREKRTGPGVLLERRRRHLRQRDDILHRAVMLRGERGDRLSVRLACHDLADNRRGVSAHAMSVLVGAGRYWTSRRARARRVCGKRVC